MAEERKLPKFLTENDDGTWTVEAKGKQYVFQELNGGQVLNARKSAEKLQLSEEVVLAMKSLKSPEMSQSDILDLPGSVMFKFAKAMEFVYGIDDF